jgi:DNA-binding SARP family transcriptional activator
VEFRLLGALEILEGDELLAIRGATQRAVLALLLLHAQELVRVEQLVDELWGDAPPATARKMVRNAVSQLRKLLGSDDVLATRPGGYLLQVDPQQIDIRRFERLVEAARQELASDRPAAAVDLLREAGSLWRGSPLADFPYEPFAQSEISRLEDLRLAATEARIEAELALGRHAELVAELEGFVAQHPLRETLRIQLMLALYRSGRQAEALAAYKDARTYLSEELGIDPSPALQRLERAILVQDPALEPAQAPAERVATPARPTPARPVRKTVTVLYAELERRGDRVDPEAFRELTARVGERLGRVIEEHGGSVDTAPSGALVALFGVPSLHEDDALRALRAAVELGRAAASLNEELEREWRVRLAVKAGVATGEALVEGVDARAASITGDLIGIAARLAQSAAEGEVLLNASTERIARSGVRTEPAGEIELAGEPQPVRRLLHVDARGAPIPRRLDSPLVGREWELGELQRAFERITRGRTSYLVTILGPAGIGKSRLAQEFLSSLGQEAVVLTGQCPSYGEGVTFWPLVEMIRQAAGEASRDAVLALMSGEDEAEQIADWIAGAIGVGEPVGSAVEVFWATRKLFTALAREQPLVLVLEDIQWAEPTMLDLLDHLVETTRDAPILLVCLARPELLDERRSWGGGKLNAASILLEPLTPQECVLVIENAGGAELPEGAAERIAQAAEGNPLFLEQMVAMALEEQPAGTSLAVPPTIQALLAARLDRLDPEERAVLERASVVGTEFWRGAVVDLTPADARDSIGERLEALSRRELIGPAASPLPGDEGHRFRHALIREAAYDGLPKLERAELHERFAQYLERTPEHPAGEHEEIVGYHLEQTYRYRTELGATDESVQTLARRAAELLADAGRRAYARHDVPAAVSLLTRAVGLLEEPDPARLELLPDLGEAVRESGDYPRGELVLAEAIDAAAAAGDRALEAYARLIRLRMRVQTHADLGTGGLLVEAQRAIDAFEEFGDERSLGKAWELLAWARWMACQAEATEEALQRSIEHARRAGDSRTEAQSLHLLLGATLFGPLPVTAGIRRCEEILAEDRGQMRVTASALRALAALTAMQGEFEDARTLMSLFRKILDELGLRVTAASASETEGLVELLAGDPVAAERKLRSGYQQLEEMGETFTRANLAALLAQALHAQSRDEEALAVTELGELAPATDDVSAQVHLKAARAKVLARVGGIAEAEGLAREAVALARTTDFLVMWGDALADLAEVLRHAGRPGEAVPLLEEALQLYERKGNTVSAGRVRELLATPGRKG